MSLNEEKVVSATKWSALAEVCAKLVTPLVSLVLARMLIPEDFGVVAILTAIVSFAENIADSGFSNYLIQHDFKDDDSLRTSAHVAFWSNLSLSLIIWFLIVCFGGSISEWLDTPSLRSTLPVACAVLPLGSLASTPLALYKRNLNFRPLFFIRIVSCLAPLLVTVPLAYCLRSYWALVIGTVVQKALVMIVALVTSPWKPKAFYSFRIFSCMFSFSFGTVVESFSIWLCSYIDILVVTKVLDSYYTGLYRGALSLVGQILGLVTAITSPVLFSSLSRLQNEPDSFKKFFLKFQNRVALFVFPMGVFLFCFSDWLTVFLLGSQWEDAAIFVAWWGLSSAIAVVLCHYCSEIYRSVGKPLFSALAQMLHLIVLVPVILYAVRYGYESLCVARSLVRLQFVLVHLIITYYVIRLSPLQMIDNMRNPLLASLGMFFFASYLITVDGMNDKMVLCSLASLGVYLLLIICFKKERVLLNDFLMSMYERYCRR